MINKHLKILDCTLRDGGYYNNWDFDHELVDLYLKSMGEASIDVVEIGFRSPPKNSFMGPYVYSLDDHLETLPFPKNILIGVMINAKEYLQAAEGPLKLINMMFQSCEKSPVGLVRIAINFDQVLEAEVLANQLKKLGYKVGLNLMQSHGKEEHQYKQTAKVISEWGSVAVLYFADSFGNMDHLQITFICEMLLSEWQGPLGIHTHNNKNMALANSIAAKVAGVTWFDSTVMGMGRGAGNVSSESLLMEFEHFQFHRGQAKLLSPCLEKFNELYEKYHWGPNHLYHYAANNNIHPTFVQSLLNDPRFYTDQIFPTLETLAKQPSTSFNSKMLKKALYPVDIGKGAEGDWDATGWLENREVLLVGAGPSVAKHKKGILNFIQKKKPAVIFINLNSYLPNKIADATILANDTRANFDMEHYLKLNQPIIMPVSNMRFIFNDKLDNLNILDYGFKVEENKFKIGPRGCYLHWPLPFAYALSVLTVAKAREIFLAGFDGYSLDDFRQTEMNEVLSNYKNLPEQIPIKAITPTNYQIRKGSVYEPVS